MKTIRIERSMLVLEVEQYDLDVPDDFDADAAIWEDFGDFDERVIADGTLVPESYHLTGVDPDDLTLTVVKPA